MDISPWIPLTLILAWLALLAATLWMDHQSRLRIRHWADQRGYGLIRLEFQRHFLGLLFWLPLVQRGQWYIEVEDPEGGLRSGWVHFGPWWFEHPWGRISVQWR